MSTKTQLIENVLNRLRGALGTGEQPAGHNHNFITVWYNAKVKSIGDGPWCEMTNTWAMWTSGAKALKSGQAYTVYACRDAIAGLNGSTWHYGTSGMQAGDDVYYDWSGRKGNVGLVDHTGTVEKINGNGTFYVLEGNVSDRLVRQLRDDTFVVGFVRFDWDRLVTSTPVPQPKPPVVKPKSDVAKIVQFQTILHVTTDGKWGPTTDARALRLRTAAKAHEGYPKNLVKPFNVRDVQSVIGTTIDGDWGSLSQASLGHWVRDFQRIVGVSIDGKWGPMTENAFLTFRSRSLNNF